MAAPRKNRIFIVDDHPLVREWLANLVNQESDLCTCGEADSAPAAIQGILSARPDLAIVDISLKSGSGIELIKDIRRIQPDVQIIVLSMHDEMQYAERALRAGARGYVMKRETTSKVIDAIRAVLAGRTFVSERVTAHITASFINGEVASDNNPESVLSDRELEVFRLMGQGSDVNRIATTLGVNFKTIHSYCARIKTKLGLKTATELLSEAVRAEERRNRA